MFIAFAMPDSFKRAVFDIFHSTRRCSGSIFVPLKSSEAFVHISTKAAEFFDTLLLPACDLPKFRELNEVAIADR
jgi:hypothetical protein